MIEQCYFDAAGNPCLHKDGNAKLTRKYDDRGNLIEECYYDAVGNPCLHKDGFAKLTRKYDDRGNMIEQCYFDAAGNPCLHKDGNAKLTRKYDDRGNLIEECYYDIEGNLCLCKDGYAILKAVYNEKNLPIEACYYGTQGEPVNVRGYFKDTRVYDERNNVKEFIYTDKDGNLLAEQVFTQQVTFTQGEAQAKGLPVGCVCLQWNEWKIGDSQADFLLMAEKTRYSKKDVYFLTPSGEIVHLHVDRGLMGVGYRGFMVEKSHAQEWLKQLEKWKEENLISESVN